MSRFCFVCVPPGKHDPAAVSVELAPPPNHAEMGPLAEVFPGGSVLEVTDLRSSHFIGMSEECSETLQACARDLLRQHRKIAFTMQWGHRVKTRSEKALHLDDFLATFPEIEEEVLYLVYREKHDALARAAKKG